jgi:hypothetical protein
VAERRMREHIRSIEQLIFSPEKEPAEESATPASTHESGEFS